MQRIREWLHRLGLEELAPAFEQQRISFALLHELSEQDLKEIGIAAMGDRKTLLKAIAQLPAPEQLTPNEPSSPTSKLPVADDPRVDGERRQLTVLFCDLAGFTELAHRLDPEALRAVIRIYEDLCAGAITRYEGYVYQRLGDGIVAYFGYPLAHEGEAERAIRASLDIIDSLSRQRVSDIGHLQVRIGIATGLVVVSHAGDKGAIGETMNLASRLQSIAPIGGIVIAEKTRQLASGAFEYEELGERQLKGIPAPVRIWGVLSMSAIESRFEAATRDGVTPLVGREQELGLLLARWQQSREGEGQVVLLSGEPGIGKSRMLSALRERLRDDAVAAIRLQCSPYHINSALHPFAQAIERRLEFGRDESPSAKLEKLETWVAVENKRPIAVAHLLARVLALPTDERYPPLTTTPQRQKEDTLRGLVDLIEIMIRREATLMVFEDAHWADPTSLEVLDLLIDRVREAPLLLVISSRPEFQPQWSAHSHFVTLNVSRLSRSQIAWLVFKVTAGKALPSELLEQIISKTDGVPLFVEELTKAILESTMLKDVGGRYEYSGSTETVSIPATLHDSLMARLDRLLPVKEIAQIGAALGREFTYEMMGAVAALGKAELDDGLEKLTASGLVFRRGSGAGVTYMFKHALVQDAAYESLLKSTRQSLHGKIAQVMSARPEIVSTQPDLLAHHHALAGNTEEAIALWQRAAEDLIQRFVLKEAIALLERALSVATIVPSQSKRQDAQLRIRITLARAALMLGGWHAPDVWKHAQPAHDLALSTNRHEELVPLFWMLCANLLCNGPVAQSLEWVQRALTYASTAQRRDASVMAHMMAASAHTFLGNFTRAVEHANHTLAHHRDEDTPSLLKQIGQDGKTTPKSYLTHVTWIMGFPDRALQIEHEKTADAHQLGHPFVLGFALGFGSMHLTYRRDATALLERADECERLGIEHSLPFFSLIDAPIHRGHAAIVSGNYAEGVRLLRQGLDFPVLPELLKPFHRSALAFAEAHLGHYDDALATIQAAQDQIERPGWEERMHYAEVLRVKGWILQRLGRIDEAQTTLTASIDLALQQQAKSWELRSATTLAHLMKEQGKPSEARHLLKPVYDWFTEGFDTPDLKDAKALLESLGPSADDCH